MRGLPAARATMGAVREVLVRVTGLVFAAAYAAFIVAVYARQRRGRSSQAGGRFRRRLPRGPGELPRSAPPSAPTSSIEARPLSRGRPACQDALQTQFYTLQLLPSGRGPR
jgi:hypothetical protein